MGDLIIVLALGIVIGIVANSLMKKDDDKSENIRYLECEYFNNKIKTLEVRRFNIASDEIAKFILALSGHDVKFNDERDIEIQRIHNLVSEGFDVLRKLISRYDKSLEILMFHEFVFPNFGFYNSLWLFSFALLMKEFTQLFDGDQKLLDKVKWDIKMFFMEKQHKRYMERQKAEENRAREREQYLKEGVEIYDQRYTPTPREERIERFYFGSRELEYYDLYNELYDNNIEYNTNFVAYYEFIFWESLKTSKTDRAYGYGFYSMPKRDVDFNKMMKISFKNGVLSHLIAYLCTVFRECCMSNM